MDLENTEKEIKLSIDRETQARIFPRVSADSADQIRQRLRSLFLFAGFKIPEEQRLANVDEYYDTAKRNLAQANSLLRVRDTTNGFEVAVKKPLERRTGTFTRFESERRISAEEYERLKRSNFYSVIQEHFRDIIDERILHTATVENQRIQLLLDRNDEQYKLAIDRLQFVDPLTRNKSSSRLEIEIEAMSPSAVERLDDLKRYLVEIYPEFTLSDRTKYEAALEYVDKDSRAGGQTRQEAPVISEVQDTELHHVQEIRDRYALWNRLLISLLVAVVGLGAILLQAMIWPTWLRDHPHKWGLYGSLIVIVIAVSWAIAHKKGRTIALGGVVVGAGSVILQTIG